MRAAGDQLAKCVHCGFCLPACPTYLLDGVEMDSPRGRIYLLNAVERGRLGISDSFITHFDRCLGCLACVSACPSGVGYDAIVDRARDLVERSGRRWTDRLFRRALFAVLPHHRRLRLLAAPLALVAPVWRHLQAIGQRVLPGGLRSAVALAPAVRWADLRATVPELTPAAGPRRLRVAVLQGCVQRVFFPRVNAATVRVLAAEGCDVWAPAEQGCCGALAFHAGREDLARPQARALIAALDRDDVDRIVVNAAGCGSTMKRYGALLADDPAWAARAARFAARVRDATELLDELGAPAAPRHPLPIRVAYHDACHLAHGQGIRTEPRRVLARIPGLQLLPLEESEVCCGSAGIYNLVQPERASRLGARKAAHVGAAAADVVATANPGCMLQIASALEARGVACAVRHPIEIVDASIRGVPAEALLR